ncbi:amino acid ABC transporter permease [Limosilactobacillus agrestis]|uniref:Amino acid ABC transporter permease n=1 Tax=Limosilactobacillus agrestis TaxID=2759748 RepID=A0A7W3UHU2_9LACO|nr:amino acid ABC transporter permease [Limosilactobacillus agrestis]MBB1095893.1 amino acid ABC transporter permease [Limosilactobacillus agrestis]MCD7112389.1 amino acid ABC transporter permease [Limosilactobacillus agrestis]MCD7119585.1 amino acid ABC transporter permease [Limosilactobacillus agrestis]MCD7129911.1 amino acid ABC transporter permease [Limosilactobacillus agrestis]
MWEIIKTSLPQLLAAGFKYTIPLAIISFFFGLIIALITALIRLSRQHGVFMILKWIASFYVWLFRSTPLLVQLFIVFFGLPYLRIKGILPHGIKLEPFTAGIITFSLNTGAYASETIRAAISAVPTGQWEAGAAIGMTRLQILWRIILPQALRVALPPLSNSFISLVKDTSLAASITIMEMFAVSQQIAAENYQPLLMYTLVAIVYAAFTTILSYFQGYLERVVDRQVNANNR